MQRVSGPPTRPALFSNTDRIAILPAATSPRLGRTGECPRLQGRNPGSRNPGGAPCQS